MKDTVVSALNEHLTAVSALRNAVAKEAAPLLRKKSLQDDARTISRQWFDTTRGHALTMGLTAAQLQPYDELFKALLTYSGAPNRRASYLKTLDGIRKTYRKELIQFVEVSQHRADNGPNIEPYLEGIPDTEKAYLLEAKKCAAQGCLRAAIILGWCATIDRIHRKIMAVGFDRFSKATEEMKARDFGRFKRFMKSYRIETLSELREVFDTDILWIVEYLSLIDSNQHERLRHCFTMRNNSAHPGEAPITGENLYSFYSDVTSIVLKNKAFDV